jgi:phospholipid/cholesterol/gamma-HCH transport system substrate-binding protein
VRRQIAKQMPVFIAILVLVAGALGIAAYILSNQRFYLPGWVPGIGTSFYEIEAELPTAQAIVPGQGQTVNIAGVPVGDVGSVELENGRAIVTMRIKEKYAPIHRNATILMRPKTALKDMFLALDPGTPAAGNLPDGGRVGVANTLPDVNPDEVLANLDGDTRAYLQILIDSGGRAFSNDNSATEAGSSQTASADLRETLKRFEPLASNGRKLTAQLALRRSNIKHVVHNFQELSTALAAKDRQLASLIGSSDENFSALADEQAQLREALQLFPATLSQTATTLNKTSTLAAELGPTLEGLRPFARKLAPALRATRPFFRETTPIIRDQIRPFATDVQPTVRDLKQTATDLAPVTPALTRTFTVVNKIFNELAYDPPGASDSFLFWSAWGAHSATSMFTAQDAHGPIRRGVVMVNCPSYSVLRGIVAGNPRLGMLTRLLNPVPETQACPQNFVPPGQTPIGATP